MVLRCPHWVTRRTTVLLRNQKAKRRADFPGKASGLGHAGMLLVIRVISWKKKTFWQGTHGSAYRDGVLIS